MSEHSSSSPDAPVASAPAPTLAPGTATEGRRRGRTSSLLRVIQFASVLGVVLLVALAAYYYFYATRQEDVLAARNVRALVTMSSRVGATLSAADQVLRNLDTAGLAPRRATMFGDLAVRLDKDQRDSTRSAALQRGLCAERARDSVAIGTSVTTWALVDAADGTCIGRTFLTDKDRVYGLALLSTRIFSWIVSEPVERGVVESAMLVDKKGVVLVQSGAPELEVHRLDELVAGGIVLPKVKGTPPPAPTWKGISSNASRVPILISGTQYELFVQPCCHQERSLVDRGLVVAALIRSNGLRKQSLQISYSLVALIIAMLVLASTTMPFLKFKLVGPLQRIRPTDVLLLAFCSILSASLTSVVALDVYAYNKLRRELDQQLVRLADSIASHFSTELRLMHDELRTLVQWQRQDSTVGVVPNLLARRADTAFTYPFFESWTMVNAGGRQARKWSFDKSASRLVDVSTRGYFQSALAGGSWNIGRLEPPMPLTGDSNRFTIESIQSWTTGKRQAILSIPTGDSLPVATMTSDLASVIDPIIAPNFTFAIVDSTGKVLFHSDKRRNLQENLFAETDQNRAIRSAVFARTSVMAGVKYGGDDRRAYVRPVKGLPWSVVTFRDENAMRVTNLETVATTVYLVVLYAIVMVMLGLGHVVIRRRRLSWLWPDRTRGEDYIRLAAAFAVLLFAFVLALASLRDSALLSASVLLPLEGVLFTWAVLRLSPSEAQKDVLSAWQRGSRWLLVGSAYALLALTTLSGGDKIGASLLLLLVAIAIAIVLDPRDEVTRRLDPWLRRWPTSRRYLLGATLLLLLVCVFPALGFFQIAYRAQTQTFVRHGQLRMALSLETRNRRIEQTYNDTTGSHKSALRSRRLCTESLPLCGLDLYSNIFFRTDASIAAGSNFSDEAIADVGLLELLGQPYEAESSVERRPLIHHVAADGIWKSAVSATEARLSYKPLGREMSVNVRSDLPVLMPSTGSDYTTVLVILLALPALTWVAAAFVSRRLFLLDLLDVRPIGELTPGERKGRNLIAVCRSQQDLDYWGPAVDVLDVNLETTGQNVRVFLPPFDAADTHARALHERRLVALERLVLSRHAVVEILVRRVGSEAPLRDRLDLLGGPPGTPEGRDRLAELMDRFVVVDAARTAGAADEPGPNALTTTTTELARSALSAEEAGDPELRKLWSGIALDLADGSIHGESYGTNPALLDRLGERAESYYDSIWATSSPRERVVMVHLAEDGFANSKDHDVLRRLLMRGLLRRTPRIALLNETFRRFVMHRGSAEEAIAERNRELSVWDGIRLPIIILLSVVLVFFLVTQQEFFNSVTAVLAGVVTGLPVFVRLAGWISDKRRAA